MAKDKRRPDHDEKDRKPFDMMEALDDLAEDIEGWREADRARRKHDRDRDRNNGW